MPGADLGRGWTDDEIEAWLRTARVPFERPDDVAEAVAECLADDGVVAWFQGRSEFGPRALGHRSLLAHPGHEENLERLNDVKGREQFRPVAPMVLAERAAADLLARAAPLAVHALRPRRRDRSGATASRPSSTSTAPPGCRPSTADDEPLVARMLEALRAAHRPAGGRQHQPQHRRPADGRRPARRVGVLRLGAGRTCWRSAPSSCGGRGAPMSSVRHDLDRRPHGGPPEPRGVLLEALAERPRAVDGPVIVVDDRPGPTGPLDRSTTPAASTLPGCVPARAAGARPRPATWAGGTARTPWVSFLDDDVVPDPDWFAALAADLGRPPAARRRHQAGSGCRCPTDRRPTDWERGTAGLADARVDHRRPELPPRRAGRGRRLRRAVPAGLPRGRRPGAAARPRTRGSVVAGARAITHPVRPSDDWASLRQQAGNADDRLMRALHGPRLAGPGRRAAGPAAPARRGDRGRPAAAAGARDPAPAARRRRVRAGWLAGTAEFAWARDRARAPRPRGGTPDAADQRRDPARGQLARRLRGALRHRHAAPWRGLPDLVLLDRDGTLVARRALQRRPRPGAPMPGARRGAGPAARARRPARRGHQPVRGRPGRISRDQVEAVNAPRRGAARPVRRVVRLPARPRRAAAPAASRAPGMVKQACADLGVDPDRCVVVGDIGSDVEAAAAGGRARRPGADPADPRRRGRDGAARGADAGRGRGPRSCGGDW